MIKNIKRVYQFGGGVIDGEIKHFIAISFGDSCEYIENNVVDSIKKQVNNFIKKMND